MASQKTTTPAVSNRLLGEEVVGDDADAGCPGVDGQQVGDDGRGQDRDKVTGDVEPGALGVSDLAGVTVAADPA